MRLQVPEIDARTIEAKYQSFHRVVDMDTGVVVGFVKCNEGMTGAAPTYKRLPTRAITLFGGKYEGRFESHNECQAFADGVAAVLDHVTFIPAERDDPALA